MITVFVALWLSGESIRILGHITRPDGGFQTQIILTNPTTVGATATLEGYSLQGNLISSVTLSLGAQQARFDDAARLFGSQDVSHVRVTGDSKLVVSASYQADSGGSPAQVQATGSVAKVWMVLPGNWDLSWDGIAVVNTGDETADVAIDLVYKTGDVFDHHVLAQMKPFEKRLLVFGDMTPMAKRI